MSLARRLMRGGGLAALAVGAAPSSVTGSSTASTVTSNTATVTARGGSGNYSYAAERVSGNAAIGAATPAAASSYFQATGMGVGTITATFRWKVTDTNTSVFEYTNPVTVSLTRYEVPPPTLTLTATNASQSGNSSSPINVTAGSTATASGGSGSYTSYSWPDVSGFTKTPSGNTCYYGATALGPGQSRSGSGTVYVTDSNGNSAGASFTVSCQNTGSAPPPFSVSASPSGVYGGGSTQSISTGSTTASANGAVGAVTWKWVRTSGVGSIGASTSATTNFTATGMVPYVTVYGTFQVTGTDSLGRTATAEVSATFERGNV